MNSTQKETTVIPRDKLSEFTNHLFNKHVDENVSMENFVNLTVARTFASFLDEKGRRRHERLTHENAAQGDVVWEKLLPNGGKLLLYNYDDENFHLMLRNPGRANLEGGGAIICEIGFHEDFQVMELYKFPQNFAGWMYSDRENTAKWSMYHPKNMKTPFSFVNKFYPLFVQYGCKVNEKMLRKFEGQESYLL